MKLNLQIKKVKHFNFFLAAQIALMSFTCLVNLGQSQLNLPQHDYDYYDHTGVNHHTHHHHYSHNTHVLPVNPYRHHQKPQKPISNRHNWISGTFYDQEDFKGLPMAYYFSGKSCVNFPLYQKMASLKPYGCVMLFKFQDCQGPVSMVLHDMPNLHAIGMSDGIASIKNCLPTDHYKPVVYQRNLLPQPQMRFPSYKKK